MNLKIGKKVYTISDKDVVLDNGSVYQLITKTNNTGWYRVPPVIPEIQFNKLLKIDALKLVKVAISPLTGIELKYYQFDISKLSEEEK